MFFGEIVVAFTVLLCLAGFAGWVMQLSSPGALRDQFSPSAMASGLLVALFVVLMALRSVEFGTDTEAYVGTFKSWCYNGDIDAQRTSYYFSVYALNAAMLGACNAKLLPMAWIFAIVFILFLANESVSFKLRMTVLLLMSIIGVDLSTNVLRQSFSVGFAVISISFLPRNRAISLVSAGLSVISHESAALYLTAGLLSFLRWRWFIAGVVAGISIIAISLYMGAIALFIEPLIYEIQKYLDHESNELYVRIMAMTTIVVAILAPLLSSSTRSIAMETITDSYYQSALKILFSAVPFLALPYFGYRYLYGAYPLILWGVLKAVEGRPDHMERTFWYIVLPNAGILTIWAYMSDFVSTDAFF